MEFGRTSRRRLTTREKLIRHLKNDVYARVGVSKISGVGVIAIRTIPKGVDPFKTLAPKNRGDNIVELTQQELTRRNVHPAVRKIADDFFGHTENGTRRYDMLASGPNNINLSFYMNHSDHSNIAVVESSQSNYLGFVTKRKIRKGEELTINYADYD